MITVSRYGATDRLAMLITWISVGAIPTPASTESKSLVDSRFWESEVASSILAIRIVRKSKYKANLNLYSYKRQ